jgi:hypothetical protein
MEQQSVPWKNTQAFPAFTLWRAVVAAARKHLFGKSPIR